MKGKDFSFTSDTYINPADLGLYYLNSRFYDPAISRFINADTIDVLAINQGNLLQHNLYTYCLNNPVNREDIEGNSSILACAALGGAVAGGIISAMSYAVNCSMNGQEITAKEILQIMQ